MRVGRVAVPMPNAIVRPPRAFQLVITFVFPEDPRDDTELTRHILSSVCPSLEIGPYARGAGIVQIPATSELLTPSKPVS